MKRNRTTQTKQSFLVGVGVLSTVLVLVLGACKKDDPTDPDCARRNVGTLVFANTSTDATYRVVLDGAALNKNLGPGQTLPWEVAAAKHSVVFYHASNGAVACSESDPVVPACESQQISCDGELAACRRDGTGILQLENHSSTGSWYYAYVDGVYKGTIAPAGKVSVTVSASTTHKVDFRYTNRTGGCSPGYETVSACGTLIVYCTAK